MLFVSFPAVCMPDPTLCTSVCTLDVSAWLPQPLGSSGRRLAVSLGEFSGLACFRGILTFSVAFAGVNASASTLCTSVRTFDVSAWSPSPSDASGVHLVASPGKSGGFCRFRGVLTISGAFAVVNADVSVPSRRIRMLKSHVHPA